MKNLGARWFGWLILLVCLSGYGQPPIPAQFFYFPTNFYTAYGAAPLARTTNLISVPMDVDSQIGLDANALILDTSNLAPAFLAYNIIDTTPRTNRNISYSTGTVLFYYAPNWSSVSQGGTGPGETAYFVAGGDWSSNSPNGLFAIYADAAGSNIYFGGVQAGVAVTYASAPISWGSNTFHQLGFEWSPYDNETYLDGAMVATGNGVTIVPTRSTWTNGFFIGSDNTGHEQARGAFWEMMTWTEEYGGWYAAGWPYVSNVIATWQTAQGGGGFSRTMGAGLAPGYQQGVTYTTNYSDYTNFWLSIGTGGSNTQATVTLQNTQSNLTYEILTNSTLDTNLADWGVWQVLTATNSVIVAPPFNLGSNSMFFASQLVLITGTNQIADWWQMKYFGQLGVDPYSDPDLDGLCNYSEYILGSNPTNAHSMSASKTDAQCFFLAYTNDSSTRLLLFQNNGPGTNAVTLTLSNTLVGSNYQIYSKDLSVTNGAWRVETNFVGTNTATQITILLGGRMLAFIGGDGEDPDGDGLPSGYEVLATHTDPLLADTRQHRHARRLQRPGRRRLRQPGRILQRHRPAGVGSAGRARRFERRPQQ